MDSLDPFTDEVIDSVATITGRDPAAVSDLVLRHQQAVCENPGVVDLVYELRRTLPYDPLVRRTEAAYYLVVRERIWMEFERAGFSEEELDTLQCVHDRQARSHVRQQGDDTAVFDGGAPMVLALP